MTSVILFTNTRRFYPPDSAKQTNQPRGAQHLGADFDLGLAYIAMDRSQQARPGGQQDGVSAPSLAKIVGQVL